MCVCVCYRVSSGQVSHRIPEGMITRLCLAPFSQELYPAMPSAEPFNGELCKVTEFDRTRQESCFNSNGHRSILEETEEDAYTKHYWSIKVTAFVCICHVLLDMVIFFSLTQTWGIRDIGGYIYIYIYIYIVWFLPWAPRFGRSRAQNPGDFEGGSRRAEAPSGCRWPSNPHMW